MHAHRPDAIQMAADAGCSQIEHAWLADRAAIETVAKRGMYLGNQIDVLFRNYAENGTRFDGVGGFTLAGLANLQEARPGAVRVFRQSLEVPGLKMVFNTDANAGGHGRNAEEIVANVEQGGQRPMDAVIAATSRAAAVAGPRRPHRRDRPGDGRGHHRPGRQSEDRRRLVSASGVR